MRKGAAAWVLEFANFIVIQSAVIWCRQSGVLPGTAQASSSFTVFTHLSTQVGVADVPFA